MKAKVIIVILSVLLAFFSVNNAFAGIALKLGLDWEGDYDVQGNIFGWSGSTDVDMGFSLAGEFFASLNKNFDLGAGVSYQFPRSWKDDAGDFYFIPIYGMARLRSSSEKIAPYVIGQAGYNFFFGDSDFKAAGSLDGGLYYGIGGGIIIKKRFEIEALYSVNEGSRDSVFGIKYDIEYSKVSIMFGYIF